jgi:hypothetical protein
MTTDMEAAFLAERIDPTAMHREIFDAYQLFCASSLLV